MGDDPQRFSFIQDVFNAFQELAAFRSFSEGMADPCQTVRVLERSQLGSDMYRWLKAPIKKRGEDTGPSPVDRGKSGTNIHLATDGRGMPLGAVITGANANDGQQAGDVFESLVIKPPAPEVIPRDTDPRDLPSAHGDGAYGNEPTRQRAEDRGFRMRAPKRG